MRELTLTEMDAVSGGGWKEVMQVVVTAVATGVVVAAAPAIGGAIAVGCAAAGITVTAASLPIAVAAVGATLIGGAVLAYGAYYDWVTDYIVNMSDAEFAQYVQMMSGQTS